jgi:hypothetical protein
MQAGQYPGAERTVPPHPAVGPASSLIVGQRDASAARKNRRLHGTGIAKIGSVVAVVALAAIYGAGHLSNHASVPGAAPATSAPAQSPSAHASSSPHVRKSDTAVTSASDPHVRKSDAAAISASGSPSITGVSLTQPTVTAGAGAEIEVAVTVNPGGEASSCTYSITVSGGGNDTGVSCSTTAAAEIAVPDYNTSYSVTVTASNAAGSAPAYSPKTGTSSTKAMTLNALTAFNCTSGLYCGAAAHLQAGPAFNASTEGAVVPANGVVYASCVDSNGGAEHGADAAYPSNVSYYVWVKVTSSYGNGWASELYFPNPPTVSAGLPSC